MAKEEKKTVYRDLVDGQFISKNEAGRRPAKVRRSAFG